MNILVICNECNESFPIGSENIVKREFNYNGNSIWLTYYDCPKCDKRHFVQIDDERTNLQLRNITRQMALMARGNSISKKQSAKFDKMREEIKLVRSELMNQFEGTIQYDKDTNRSFKLNFSDYKLYE